MNDSEHWAHVDELPRPVDTDTRQLVDEGLSWLSTAFWTAMAVSVVVVAYAVMTWGAR